MIKIFQQNMALIGVGYKAKKVQKRKDCIRALIKYLKSYQPDVVGLSEVFRGPEKRMILRQLRKIYPHHFYGPNRWYLLSGGLLLLSKHPLNNPTPVILQNSSQIDAICAKGFLWCEVDHPLGNFQVALCHLQNPDAGGLERERDVTMKQLEEMRDWLNENENPEIPSILMGDFNTDSYDRHKTFPPQSSGTYEHMDACFKNYKDLWLNCGEDHPGITYDEESRFHKGEPLDPHHESRFRKGMRLDYFWYREGKEINTLKPVHIRMAVVENMPGREISDHYGLLLELES